MKKLIAITTIMLINLPFLNANSLEVGSPAPQVSGINHLGETVDLGATFAEGITLVFFYPKADTPGCTAQACSLRDSFEELAAADIKMFGVSSDSVKSQAKFASKYELPYTLIADEDNTVAKAFGRGMWSRQAFLIKDGVVIWRDLKASTGSQAADVKKALSELGLKTFVSIS
jgi:thioredoxin-dependent peroxiredoxin